MPTTMEYTVKTPHFSFILRVEEHTDNIPKHKLFVGDEKGPCLEATIFLESANVIFEPHICILHKIDALEECAQQDIENDSASLGLELLYAFINILKNNYFHVSHISLRDASYIPCNRRPHDTLDLLSYDIALYGKTWYEMHTGAYLPSPSKQQRYEKEISVYMSAETKKSVPFSDIMRYIIKHNDYAYNQMKSKLKEYEDIYNDAITFSDFFRILKKNVKKHDLCRFFKEWLELFVQNWIRIERDWIIPIHENYILSRLGVLNEGEKKPVQKRRTRKAARKYVSGI